MLRCGRLQLTTNFVRPIPVPGGTADHALKSSNPSNFIYCISNFSLGRDIYLRRTTWFAFDGVDVLVVARPIHKLRPGDGINEPAHMYTDSGEESPQRIG